MSDIFKFDSQTKADATSKGTRISYTLNNSQPVRCTLIGEDPMFYMDDAAITDDLIEEYGQEEGLKKSDMDLLRREIAVLERLSAELGGPTQDLSHMIAENSDSLRTPYNAAGADIASLLHTLRQSRSAAAYVEAADKHGVHIAYNIQVRDAQYDRKAGMIFINPIYSQAEQLLLATRELRRHWQHRQGALVNPLTFTPDHAILVNRLQVADLCAAMVRIAWELQLAGEKSVWEHIENSPMADMGRAFAREAFLDFRTLNNGMAAASVFESWFLSERCKQDDRLLIKTMLADYQGYVFNLGTQAGLAISPKLISALGEVPVGKNYLSGHIQTLLSDPIFTDVRDRSNANFLWFIKFERSFRETEQALQTPNVSQAGGVRRSGLPNDTQDQSHDKHSQRGEAQIIRLHAVDPKIPVSPVGAAKRKGRGKINDSNVVYLRRWSGE